MKGLVAAILSLAVWGVSNAEDWPQWMGVKRDGHWNEKDTLDKFPKDGPKVLWRTPAGIGYAGPAVVGKQVYLHEFLTEGKVDNNFSKRAILDGKEQLRCLNAETGKDVWKYAYDVKYEISYPGGPRATPTVDGDHVYLLGAEGHLACLNTKNGEKVWAKELKTEYKTTSPMWGFCSHPLVDGDKLIVLVGGKNSAVVAFDKKTGKELWKALDTKDIGYCCPVIIEAGRTRQLIIWHSEALVSLDPEKGTQYWSQKLAPSYGMSIMTPAKVGDYLYVGGIVNKGLAMKLSTEAPKAELAYTAERDTGVFCKISSPVVVDNHLYGICMNGELRCVEAATGARKWETTRPALNSDKGANSGGAFVVKNGDKFFIFGETGHLVIAKLSPKGYEEIDRAKVIEPTSNTFGRNYVWSHPAFANKCAFIRNDKEIICVSLAK